MQYEADKSRTVQFRTDGSVDLEDVALSPELIGVLRARMGISVLFPMQEKVLTHLLDVSAKRLVGDLILCAPTGSGKTLAYALPVVQSLVGRKLPRLRAIVVVPTRDLAIQVSRVFTGLTQHLGVAVTVISGAGSIAAETGSLRKAEILIATPGRLVDHIENDDELDLQSVRYLVLDESDRLLQDAYQGWIDSVIPVLGNDRDLERDTPRPSRKTNPTAGILALAIQPEVSARSFTRSTQTSQECVRKILVSATQTRNPKRLVRLGLRQPTFFEPVSEFKDAAQLGTSYSVPSTLTEKGWIIRHIQDKPIALLKVLGWVGAHRSHGRGDPGADVFLPVGGAKLIFTKSIESAHRLCRLLEIFAHLLAVAGDVFEMSGDLSPARRHQVLETVRLSTSASVSENSTPENGRFLIVVCSDVLARGMDIFNVDAVINYDVPVHIRTYLHRAGRTARAGRRGTVATLLLAKQAHHFREMVREAERGHQKVQAKNLSLLSEDRDFLFARVSHALTLLRRIVTREKLGLLSADESLPNYALHELCTRIRDAEEAGENEPNSEDEWGEDRVEGESDEIAGRSLKKRRVYWKGEATLNAIALADIENGDHGNDSEMVDGEDDFRDLLHAQIARNMLAHAN